MARFRACTGCFRAFAPLRLVLILATASLLASGTGAFANQQCRFIDKRAEREACYARQDEERAAKAKAQETVKRDALESPPPTDDDRTMFRTLHSICRGC